MSDEIEPQQPEPAAAELEEMKPSHKLVRFLRCATKESSIFQEAPWPLRKLVEVAVPHIEKELADIPDEELDNFVAQYADMLLQLRSDDAVPMRVVAGNDKAFDEFAYFQAHRDEITAVLEQKALEAPKTPTESDEEPRTDTPVDQGPTQPDGLEAIPSDEDLEE